MTEQGARVTAVWDPKGHSVENHQCQYQSGTVTGRVGGLEVYTPTTPKSPQWSSATGESFRGVLFKIFPAAVSGTKHDFYLSGNGPEIQSERGWLIP